jgi:xanthine dehydrogenase accessory factor
VRTWLLDEGIGADRVLAMRAPAGLDLGAETAAEVAVSILAELVQVRRGRASFVAAPGPATMAGEDAAAAGSAAAGGPAIDDIVLLDPVCGMTVDRASVRHIADHGGVVYAFCSIACRSSFVREPSAYVGAGVQTGG